MPKLSFFTPVTYTTPSKSIESSLLEKVDDYFYLGGRKAYVIQKRTKSGLEKVILSETNSSSLGIIERVLVIFKVFSYVTIVIPILMLIAKAALRSTHHFKLIDPKQKLEKSINVSEDTAAKIQSLMPKILRGHKDDELEWLSTGNNLVFKLAQHPQLVFKIAKSSYFDGQDKTTSLLEKRCEAERIRRATCFRFENMVKAKEVCIANELNLLIIPHATQFKVNIEQCFYDFIVEESLDLVPGESAHEEFYHRYSTELNETARQLATFVAKTDFNDVTWRNVPILKEAPEFQGSRRIALIDLEHMQSAVNGFIGDRNGSRGLIRCVSEAQIDIVIGAARKQGVPITEEQALNAKNRRLQELESDKSLYTFYEKNGIITGKEPILVDLASLDLDLTEKIHISFPKRDFNGNLIKDSDGKQILQTQQTDTLKELAECVVKKINDLIQVSSDHNSTKNKRYLNFDFYNSPPYIYHNLGAPYDKFFISEEDKQFWFHRLIVALVDKGYIFKLDKINVDGYFIQA